MSVIEGPVVLQSYSPKLAGRAEERAQTTAIAAFIHPESSITPHYLDLHRISGAENEFNGLLE